MIEKKALGKQPPYEGWKPQTRARAKENAPARHNFRIDLKELITIPNVADKLKSPSKTDNRLGHLVRVPSTLWPRPTQLFGVGIPIR